VPFFCLYLPTAVRTRIFSVLPEGARTPVADQGGRYWCCLVR